MIPEHNIKFLKINQEIQKERPNLPNTPKNDVSFVGLEQALRELSDISKPTNDKP